MKVKRVKKRDFFPETDIEESSFHLVKKNGKKSCKKKRKLYGRSRKSCQKLTSKIFHIKIMRFPLKRSKKTLRVLCYDERDLKWGKKFTKQLKIQAADNDHDSDDQMIAADVQRGVKELFNTFCRKKNPRKNEIQKLK